MSEFVSDAPLHLAVGIIVGQILPTTLMVLLLLDSNGYVADVEVVLPLLFLFSANVYISYAIGYGAGKADGAHIDD